MQNQSTELEGGNKDTSVTLSSFIYSFSKSLVPTAFTDSPVDYHKMAHVYCSRIAITASLMSMLQFSPNQLNASTNFWFYLTDLQHVFLPFQKNGKT